MSKFRFVAPPLLSMECNRCENYHFRGLKVCPHCERTRDYNLGLYYLGQFILLIFGLIYWAVVFGVPIWVASFFFD